MKDKIKASEELYIAYEKRTNYPYIDTDGRIWMFSKEEYASNAADYFMQQLLMLDMKKIGREELEKTLAELHILGLPKILIDNGQYHVEVGRDDLLPPPDWSDTPEISIPVTNPDLQHAMISFFQAMNSGQHHEGSSKLFQAMEGRMLDEVIRAKYLLPMQLKEQEPSNPNEQGVKTLKEGTVIQFAVLGGEGDSTWLPMFTDWLEFEKVYDKNVWSSNIVSYEDALALSETMEGIVINCSGIPLQLNDKNKQRIEEFRRGRSKNQGDIPNDLKGGE
ncbi:hypothetical protein D3C73_1028650 [compost metagenome]